MAAIVSCSNRATMRSRASSSSPVLYSHVFTPMRRLKAKSELKAISDGFDPTIGIMHDGSDRSSKLIFDLMELERPKVDRSVLDFIKGHVSTLWILSFAATAFVG